MAELECFLKNCLPSEKLSNLTLLELHLKITLKSNPLGTKGNLQTIASSMESSSGHKLSISCEDRDESEEDPNENDDEYRPTAPGWRGKGLSRGGRTHPVGSYHQQRHLGEEHREVDGVRNQDNPLSSEEDLTSIMRTLPVVTYTHSKAITRALCRLIWYPMNEEVSYTFLLSHHEPTDLGVTIAEHDADGLSFGETWYIFSIAAAVTHLHL